MSEPAAPGITVNGVTVDFDAGLLRDATGAEVPLRAQSFAVLRELSRNAGRVVEKDALIRAVWRGVAVTDDSLVQCIGDIRRALRDEAQAVLKTVPRRGYRLVAPVAPAPERAARLPAALALAALVALALVVATSLWRRPAPPAERLPSIAVLPFDDMSAGGDLGYLGAGVADDIITMLARSPDVLVIARNSAFVYGGKPVDVRDVGAALGVDYVLEGSVRGRGDTLRIVAQLIDASTGRHIWAERFDEAGADPFALHDAVTERIIGTLVGAKGEMKRAQYRKAWGRDSASLAEYDYYLRAHDLIFRDMTASGNARVDRILREGLARFPDSQLLKMKLAWNDWLRGYFLWSDDLAADFESAGVLARELLAADALTPQTAMHAHWLMAYVHAREGDFANAVAEANVTAALAPYDAFVITDLAEILARAGLYKQALEHVGIGEARNPIDADTRRCLRGWIYRLQGRNADALEQYAAVANFFPYQRLQFAIALVRLGRLDKAREQVGAALAELPAFTQANWREGVSYSDPAILDSEVADLAAAGLPD